MIDYTVINNPVPPQGQQDAFIPHGRRCPSGDGVRWISQAWAIISPQIGLWIAYSLSFMVGYVVINLMLWGSILFIVMLPVLAAGVMLAADKVKAHAPLNFADFWSGFTHASATPLWLLGLLGLGLMGLIFLLMLLTMIYLVFSGVSISSDFTLDGLSTLIYQHASNISLLLQVFIVLMMALFMFAMIFSTLLMATPLVLFNNIKPINALWQATIASAKNTLPLVVMTVILMGFLFLAIIPMLLGLIVWLPLSMAVVYTNYRGMFYNPSYFNQD